MSRTVRATALLAAALSAGGWARPGAIWADQPAVEPTTQPADGPDAAGNAPADPAADNTPTLNATVTLCGVMVVAAQDGQQGRRLFWGQSGTRIALLIEPPEGRLVALDRAASKLTNFTDDAGQDLTREDRGARMLGFGGPFGWRHNRFGDDEAAGGWLVEIQAPRCPLPGTREVFVAGELVFRHSAGKVQAFKHETVPVKQGADIKAGRIPMRFSKVRIDEGDGPGRGMDLSIEVNESDDEIKLVRFRDDKGDEVAARVVGSSMSSREDGRVIQCVRTWRFERELETVTVEVEYWSEVRTVKVPFAETVGLGMPPPPAPPQNKQ